jgi:anti-sigma regulatory factor (Ser/Thr protein kinase)
LREAELCIYPQKIKPQVHAAVDQNLTIEVCNVHNAIAPAAEKAAVWLESFHPSREALYLVLLAIEELIMNCITYGYDDANEHTIVIKLAIKNQQVAMTVIDDGHAFDPLALSPPDLSKAVAERPIGGLGIYMLRSLADEMSYERRGHTNRLTLTKRLSEAAAR